MDTEVLDQVFLATNVLIPTFSSSKNINHTINIKCVANASFRVVHGKRDKLSRDIVERRKVISLPSQEKIAQ